VAEMSYGAPDFTQKTDVNIIGQSIEVEIKIVGSSINVPIDIKAQSLGNLKIDIAAQSLTHLKIDIASQSIGNININLADVSFTGNLNVNIAAQSLDTLNVDINLFPWEKMTENILENPGFETGDLTGWYKSGTGTAEVQSTTVFKGNYAAKITPDANTWMSITCTPYIPVKSGQKIEIVAAMKADANITKSRINVLFQSAEKEWFTTISSENYGGDYDWTVKKFICSAPDGAAYCRVRFIFTSGSTSGNGYVDSVVVARYIPPMLDEDLNLNINIAAQSISELKINITAQTVGISIQAEWQTQIGNQKIITGEAVAVASDTDADVINYTVPSGKTLFIYAVSVKGIISGVGGSAPRGSWEFLIAGNYVWDGNTNDYQPSTGQSFPVPLRANAGESVIVRVHNYETGSASFVADIDAYEV